jgi:hypothetical protein
MRSFITAAGVLLSVASTAQAIGYTNESEVPLYGQSPPVYPTRKFQRQPRFRVSTKVYNS